MNWMDFAIRMFAALFLGGAIGLERQWRQRMTGLRTNGLVAVGAAMFIMMGGLISGDSQGRVAAYVVSGIGFLGGGVILKDGFNIRGMNTAATLWCTAAVGTLAGLGQIGLAAMGTAGVLAANLILRPVAFLINRTPVEKKHEHELLYRLRCTCRTADEANIRTMLIQNVGRSPLTLVALHSLNDELLARVNVKAYLKSIGPKEEDLEQIVTRLSLEAGVTAISWEVAAAVDAEDASIATSEEVIRAT